MPVTAPAAANGNRPASASGSWSRLMYTVGVQVPLDVRRSIVSRNRLARLRVGKV